MTERTIDTVCDEYLKAKAYEAKAKDDRVALEEELIALVGKKEKGTLSGETDSFKFKTVGKMTVSMDWEKWTQIKAQVPEALHPVKMEPKLDEKGLKYLMENEPEIYKILPIESKPAKTAVEVVRKERV